MASTLKANSFPFLTFSGHNLQAQLEELGTTLAAEEDACLGTLTLDFSFLVREPAEKSLFTKHPPKENYTQLLLQKTGLILTVSHSDFSILPWEVAEKSLNKNNHYSQELC